MNRRKNLVMIALGALVAGAAALVYAQNEAADRTLTAATGADASKVLYDFNALPDPVKRMLRTDRGRGRKRRDRDDAAGVRIERAEADGRDRLCRRPDRLLEEGLGRRHGARRAGRDAQRDRLGLCPRRARQGRDVSSGPISPRPILRSSRRPRRSSFTASCRRRRRSPMKKAGKYSYYRLGISPTGVWQYFLQ